MKPFNEVLRYGAQVVQGSGVKVVAAGVAFTGAVQSGMARAACATGSTDPFCATVASVDFSNIAPWALTVAGIVVAVAFAFKGGTLAKRGINKV